MVPEMTLALPLPLIAPNYALRVVTSMEGPGAAQHSVIRVATTVPPPLGEVQLIIADDVATIASQF